MKKIKITAACGLLLFCFCSRSVCAEYDYYNDATITKDADNDGNVTYTNKANGKTYTVYANGTKVGDDTYRIKSKEAIKRDTVELGYYKEIKICLPYGQSSISNLKIKKGKGIITAKICKKTIVKGEKVQVTKNPDGSYYYRDRLTGEIVNIGSQSEMYADYADYKVRVYGKKLGKAVLEYQINDSNGNKIAKKKIKIDVKENGNAIVSATFAGKSLLLDYSKNGNNKNYIYNNGTKSGAKFTAKKSGKFKVKLSGNYRLKAIYVERLHGYEKVTPMPGPFYDGWDINPISKGLDLNGDGDFNDIIDGFEESKSTTVYYQKIKNGQKIVLNKQPAIGGNDYIDKTDGSRHTLTDNANTRSTTVYVVYQDKRTGSYYWWKTDICRLVKKV